MGLFHPRNTDDEETNHQATVRLIAQVPTILAAFQNVRQGKDPIAPLPDLSHSANFLYMINGELPDPLVEKIFDVCLILHIEHTVNASTFTSMVACSTLADPYSTVAAAIASLSGPLHGGANERVLRMLQEIGSVENARAAIEEKIADKEVIFGMGHREYKTMDPRATILKGLCAPLFEKFGCTPLYDIAVEVEKVAAERLGERGIWPNVDFYSGIVYDLMGIPSRPVHAGLRGLPRRRLGGALGGAAQRQPHLPADADLRGSRFPPLRAHRRPQLAASTGGDAGRSVDSSTGPVRQRGGRDEKGRCSQRSDRRSRAWPPFA